MATGSPAGSLAFRALGAELAITYVNDKTRTYVEPLAREAGASIFLPLNFQIPGQLEQVFERITRDWGRIDFLVHSVASAPKETLRGRVVDASREGFLTTMDVSCWSFIRHFSGPRMAPRLQLACLIVILKRF
jgi:enoyl-[acyl-carrier protein] reductase I